MSLRDKQKPKTAEMQFGPFFWTGENLKFQDKSYIHKKKKKKNEFLPGEI